MKQRPTITIFCRVVDNFGDIGVCWRLARQFSQEKFADVQLVVDDLSIFQKIQASVRCDLAVQVIESIEIVAGNKASLAGSIATPQIVIEAFGCGLPGAFIGQMAACDAPPVWINLEYLSAEEWVESFHAMTSMHPSLPLTRHFFFPGFTAGTGGLLREQGLLERRENFQLAGQRRAFFDERGIAMQKRALDSCLVISLFCYGTAPVAALLNAWQNGATEILCLVPEGVAQTAVYDFLGQDAVAGASSRRGNLTVEIIALMAQEDYDKLLWSCDINFVRGEDSFVRAQWAGRPAIWQIYPQAECAHWPKLEAFIDRYLSGAPSKLAKTVRELFQAWNGKGDISAAWSACIDLPKEAGIPDWANHARHWSATLAQDEDLATKLLQYARQFS